MKQTKTGKNPYATMQAGKIEAPRKPQGEPRSVKRTGTDLRAKK